MNHATRNQELNRPRCEICSQPLAAGRGRWCPDDRRAAALEADRLRNRRKRRLSASEHVSDMRGAKSRRPCSIGALAASPWMPVVDADYLTSWGQYDALRMAFMLASLFAVATSVTGLVKARRRNQQHDAVIYQLKDGNGGHMRIQKLLTDEQRKQIAAAAHNANIKTNPPPQTLVPLLHKEYQRYSLMQVPTAPVCPPRSADIGPENTPQQSPYDWALDSKDRPK